MRRTRFDPRPAETTPYLFVPTEPGGVLVTPFRRRRDGPTDSEIARLRAVAERLGAFPSSLAWIDPQTGATTPATIQRPQIERRMMDQYAVRLRPN